MKPSQEQLDQQMIDALLHEQCREDREQMIQAIENALDESPAADSSPVRSLSKLVGRIAASIAIGGIVVFGVRGSQKIRQAPPPVGSQAVPDKVRAIARLHQTLPPVVSLALPNRLFNEAEKATSEKHYDESVSKIQELLKSLGPNPDVKKYPIEQLYFNIGLGRLMAGKNAEAEEAFTETLKRFPRGEYSSRSYLGAGRAMMLQDTDEKRQRAVEALRAAARDPRFRSEAGLWLGQVYQELNQSEEALKVFRSLMGSDVRTPAQTTAAVEVIGLLAEAGKLEDLTAYLDRLINQSGVRDALAWYAGQVITKGDALVDNENYENALALYRSVPSRTEIIEIQTLALESQRNEIAILEKCVKAEESDELTGRSNASELLNNLKPAVEACQAALAAVQGKADFDAALMMRRGRCLYHLNRDKEALVCFRAIRNQHGKSPDAKSAAYGEIVVLNKLKDVASIGPLCEAYLRNYPDADNAEQVATLAGEVLVQSGKWDAVGKFYADLEQKFPKSDNLDRFTFYQAVAHFQAADFKASTPIFEKFLKNFPTSEQVESALYYLAMSKFFSNDYKGTLTAIKEYLARYPSGRYAGDLRNRIAFIDFSDKDEPEDKMNDKIIKDLTSFLTRNSNDLAAGSMWCLIGDVYKRKTSDKADELAKFKRQAIEAYQKAIFTPEMQDDVVQYALDSATAMLKEEKDWEGVGQMHARIMKEQPTRPFALLSAGQVAQMYARQGKNEDAAKLFADALKPAIGDPNNEQVEFVIDELVKSMIPKGKKPADINIDELNMKLTDLLNATVGAQQNATTSARIFYAQARLAESLRKRELSERYIKGIAMSNKANPSALSPLLLAACGDILLKSGDIDSAEAMYRRLTDRFRDGMLSDAGPVGLGFVALARKKPDDALKIFTTAIDEGTGMSRIKEATLGKLQSLVELQRFDESDKLATGTIGDKSFRGEPAAKAYLLRAQNKLNRARNEPDVEARLELFKQAYADCLQVFMKFKSFPETCAEGAWLGYQIAKDMGNNELANQMLDSLRADPKLKGTTRQQEAEGKD